MNKAEFVESIAGVLDLPKSEAERALNAVLDGIQKELVKGEQITFVGFGTFKTTDCKARKGRNPATGEDIDIPASTKVSFKVGKALKEAVNK